MKIKDLKEKAAKLWNKLDGFKRIVGGTIYLASNGAQAFFPHALSKQQFEYIDLISALLLGVGIFEAVIKGKYKNGK